MSRLLSRDDEGEATDDLRRLGLNPLDADDANLYQGGEREGGFGNSLAYLERRLFPEKQVVSEEERQRLLEADTLAKIFNAQLEEAESKVTVNTSEVKEEEGSERAGEKEATADDDDNTA